MVTTVVGEANVLPRHREDRLVITHSYAPDPDLKRVKAALDLWADSVAEHLIAGQARTVRRMTTPRAGDKP
jgi:hypothetical protein